MGGCASTAQLIEKADGNEEAYHQRFLEDKVLGEGAFGVVKLVHDISPGGKDKEPLASKALRKGVQFKDNTLYSPLKPEILRGECEILQTLAGQHHCLLLVAIYETPRILYMVTELCAGGEMMQYVAKQDELRTEDVSRIAFQLLDAVNHCALHGVLHRDIKPENVMFRKASPGADLRLIDFGSGTKDPDPSQVEVEKHETMAGSGLYISPELFQRKYSSKTDVWSAGVTLYILVAGYPADRLQEAFNMLHKSKRNLRDLPQMPEQMPDSFIDLLDRLLTYRPKARKSAGANLDHEFITFHQRLETAGLSLDDIAAEANEASSPTMTPLPDGSTKALRRTHSFNLSGSVQRHGMFLDYQRYERSVTTLLATLLSKVDFDVLLAKLDTQYADQEQVEVQVDEAGPSKDNVRLQKLKVIPMNELKEMLKELNQEKTVSNINKLPNAAAYSSFAYHVALLEQFAADKNQRAAPGRSRSMIAHGDKPSSVHGNQVFDKKKARAAIVFEATNKDNSWHAGQKSGGLTKANSFSR